MVEIIKMLKMIVFICTDMMDNEFRFITATCVDKNDGTDDIIYHFDKNMEIISIRLNIKKGEELESISKIYFCSSLVENEIKELFGVNIKNIAIDFKGHLLLDDDELISPMSKQIKIIKRGEENG